MLPSVQVTGVPNGSAAKVVSTYTLVGAASTWKVTALEVPPPGVGLTTVTGKLPSVAKSLGGIDAVSSVDDTYAVASAVEFQSTID